MTNTEKRELSNAIKRLRTEHPNGFYFNIVEAWNFVKDYTDISFKDATIRNYLKAFGATCEKRGRSSQWYFDGEEKEQT